MHISALDLHQFRNHPESHFEFSSSINCITGPNGSGKTNILDAIYYLCMGKSHFQSTDSLSIQTGQYFFTLKGIFNDGKDVNEIFCGVKKGSKKVLKRNHIIYEKLSEHIGLLPVVITTPNDSELITGVSEERRKYINAALVQVSSEYLLKLQQYNHLLEQRNAQLRNFDNNISQNLSILEIWDKQMQPLAHYIFEQRKNLCNELIRYFNNYYKILSSNVERVELIYQSQLLETTYADGVKKAIKKDLALQYSSFGIHRDDLQLIMDDMIVKKFSSQGQQKSFLLALRLAQYRYLREKTGITPILLLDDIFDKLDDQRCSNLVAMLQSPDFGQVIITHTSAVRLQKMLQDNMTANFIAIN